ncbi:MAG: pyridoxal phosphate-dependent aminotransferase [Phycisphaerales bacterium]|jgi:aspartate aminotransferase|nr:pyridoxal phosphate-dependent aminotransferase [Phycisphaerales bacterium]
MRVSSRLDALKPSVTVAMMNRAKAMKAAGQDVVGFTAGEPDFDTPQKIKQAAIDALLAGQTKYMPTFGDPETRRVIAEKFTRENNIPGLTADHIAISCGGKHGLFTIAQTVFDPFPNAAGRAQQELLLPVPNWVSYAPICELAGARTVEIPTSKDNGFKMTPEGLRKAITPHARLLILCTPSNPCGTMYTEQELRALASVVADAARTTAPDLLVMSDEIYEKITYGGIPHFSIGAVAEIAERVITLSGVSKAYSMTGWRVGFSCMPGAAGLAFTRAMANMQSQMTTNITSFVYPAIRTALTQCADECEAMRKAFAQRAALISDLLAKIPGVSFVKPTGAFYVFPDISAHFGKTSAGGRAIKNPTDFCEAALAENLLALVPGEDFGGAGKNCVRMSFACSDANIIEGCKRLGDFIAALR